MRHFKIDDQVFGYDENEETQLPLIAAALDAGCEELIGNWPPTPSQKEVEALYSFVAQDALNSCAQSWGYHDMISAVSYANSTNKKFKAEAVALLRWRDEVWDWVHKNNETSRSIDEIKALLPAQPERLGG